MLMSDKFVLRRKAWVMRIFLPLLRVVAFYHRLVVEGADYLPRQGPALLVVKHRATRDTLLLSLILYRFAHRSGNYLMKGKPSSIFNGILEAAGGIKVIRPKDIHRLESRAAQKAYLEQARDLNQNALDYAAWLYIQGEIVVTFPEGMFYR
jgi:1-acyl-sn-glycerol-3-phosphate acyltransferase